MITSYLKRTDNKAYFVKNVFRPFCDQCGGNPSDFADILYGKYVVEDFLFSDDTRFWRVAEYFKNTVLPHKIFVYQAGQELSRSDWFGEWVHERDQFIENLWLHDMSKFSANESFGYAFHDFKSKAPDPAFEKAWLHHKHHNPHHPEYWLDVERDGSVTPCNMPPIYVVEMIADWIGAGKAYGSSIEEWAPKNIHKFNWHPDTDVLVKYVLSQIGVKL